MDFNEALKHTLRFEGGYANNPNDSGGETFRGISRKNWPGWIGWKTVDEVKRRGARTAKLIDAALKNDPVMEQAVAIFYQANFWRPFESLEAPDRIMAKLFDTAVNVGVGAAVKMLQRTVNKMGPISQLSVDGAIGPKTRAGFDIVVDAPGGEAKFLRIFCQEQEAHYRRIVSRKPSQAEFINGWLRRAAWVPS